MGNRARRALRSLPVAQAARPRAVPEMTFHQLSRPVMPETHDTPTPQSEPEPQQLPPDPFDDAILDKDLEDVAGGTLNLPPWITPTLPE